MTGEPDTIFKYEIAYASPCAAPPRPSVSVNQGIRRALPGLFLSGHRKASVLVIKLGRQQLMTLRTKSANPAAGGVLGVRDGAGSSSLVAFICRERGSGGRL